MRRFIALAVVLGGLLARHGTAMGEGDFSQHHPVDHGISPLVEADPYYDCAAYGYQLTGGSCAPGRPPPSKEWAAAVKRPGSEPYGYDQRMGWGREGPGPGRYRGRGFGVPYDPATPRANPWQPEPSPQWGPEYMQWRDPAGEADGKGPWGGDGGAWGPSGTGFDDTPMGRPELPVPSYRDEVPVPAVHGGGAGPVPGAATDAGRVMGGPLDPEPGVETPDLPTTLPRDPWFFENAPANRHPDARVRSGDYASEPGVMDDGARNAGAPPLSSLPAPAPGEAVVRDRGTMKAAPEVERGR